jgi:glycerol-3-phosphate acyltransferase PlsY
VVASIILAIVIGYLLGSIPCAYIAGRLIKGVDIRKIGGGNMGALNTMREIGTTAGFIVFFADMAKGSLAVLVAQWLGLSLPWVFVAGFAAVAGHNWPVWVKFRGGQGLATTMGVLLVLAPIEFAISSAILVVVVLFTSNVRLGSAVGLAFLPLFIWLFGGELSLIVYSLALCLFCVLKALTRLRADFASTSGRRGFIIDREYKPWQKKR